MTEVILKKSWDVVATFSTYEEADSRRKQLLNVYVEVKVKRGMSNGEVFRVKVWNQTTIKEKINKPKNKFKKKQNIKRVEKNDNKKIRARRKKSQDFYRE